MKKKISINKDKGMKTQSYGNGKKNSIVSLLSKFLLPQYFTMSQYIALKWGMEGRIRLFLGIWKAKDQGICHLMRITPNIFRF